MISVNMTLDTKSMHHRIGWAIVWLITALYTETAQGSEYSDLVQSHGPVAYWRLGETSGTTAADTTGAHNGTYQNSVTLGSTGAIAGDTDKAANFAGGSNDRVQVGGFGVAGTGLTILAWFKADNFSDDHFVSKANGSNTSNFYWTLGTKSSSEMSTWIKIGGTTRELFCSVSGMSAGTWYFAAVTFDGSTIRVYRDGVQVGSASYSGAVTTDSSVAVALGNLPSGAGDRAFDGVLDEIAVFDKALTPAQITGLNAMGRGRFGRWKLVETSGTTATDSSSQLNHGTYTNGPVLGSTGPYPGAGDKAANFDGSNDYVAIPNESKYDITGPISVAAWIKVDIFDVAWQAVVTKGSNSWRLQRPDVGTNTVQFRCTGLTPETVTCTTNVNDGKWHHVVGVFTGNALQIYIDGTLENSVNTTGSISLNNSPVEIGRNAASAGREFDGAIHDVHVYSYDLTASDVAKLYGFVGHWKLSETSGTTAADSTPHARNGTVSGTANWSTDCGGMGVFDFNGSSNYISTTNASHLQPTSAMTIAAWVRGDSWGSGSDADTILRKGEGNPNNYQLAIADGKVGLFLDDSDSGGIRSNTILATGEWYHVAAIWDGATVKIYINGVLDNSAARTGTIGTDTRPLYIGGRSGADFFDGMVRDVRFYNRALYEADIKKLADLLGNWQFAEGTGTTAADSSGQGNTATLSGGATWTTDCAGNNNALLTNGTGGIAQTSTWLTPPDVGTIAFWMRSNGTPPARQRVFGLGGDWELRHEADGTLAFDICADAGTSAVTTVPLNEVGRWYHVAITFDSSTEAYAIYIDGALHKSGTNSNAMTQQAAAVLSFGTRTGSAEYWQGALRDFRIYNRRLCPIEIAELYGLIGHWKLDETSGTAAADSSGLGRNGTVVGTATWTTGTVNNCLQLNGSTKVEVNSLLGSPKNVTLAGWANLTAADSSGAELISIGDFVALRLDAGGTTRTFFYNGSTWPAISTSQTFANTGWHHFAAVFNDDQNYFKLYVDGTEVATTTTTATISYTGLGTKTVVGAHGNSGTTYDFTGKVDDIRVYNRALCPEEIQILKDMGYSFGGVKIIKWVEIQ